MKKRRSIKIYKITTRFVIRAICPCGGYFHPTEDHEPKHDWMTALQCEKCKQIISVNLEEKRNDCLVQCTKINE